MTIAVLPIGAVRFPSRAEDSIEQAQHRFARGDLSLEGLEAEVEFWLSTKDCDFCVDGVPGGSLCTIHYGQLVGR